MKKKIEAIIEDNCLEENDEILTAAIRDLAFPDPKPNPTDLSEIYDHVDAKKIARICGSLTGEFARTPSQIPGTIVSIINGTHPAIDSQEEVVSVLSTMMFAHVMTFYFMAGGEDKE